MTHPTHMEIFAKTAKNMGLSVNKVTVGGEFNFALHISNKNKFVLLAPNKTGFYPDTPRWFSIIANSQILSNQILASLGYLVIPSHFFDLHTLRTNKQRDTERQKITEFPVLIKPESGLKGRGFKIANTPKELLEDTQACIDSNTNFLVQPLIVKTEFRIFVANNKVYFAHKKEFPTITADGKQTVAELLDCATYEVDVNFVNGYLTKMNLTLSSIPPTGTTIPIHITRKGSDVFYKCDDIPRAITQWALTLVQSFNVRTCGIDVFIPEDVSDTGNYQIIEINSNPGFTYISPKYNQAKLVDTICVDILQNYFKL